MKTFVTKAVNSFVDYIKTDWASSKTRTIAEVYSWIASAVSGIIVSSTVPNPPWEVFYPLWLSALFCMMFCSYSRGSFGMLAFNLSLFCIDITGYIRILLAKH